MTDLNVDAEFEELLVKYQAAAFLDSELSRVTIVPRVEMVGKWMKEGDLGFVYGLRGSGKTWFINFITQHLGAGKSLHNWVIPNACNIVYVDGEMPAEDAKKRIEGLGVTGRVRLLNHELLWQESQLVMNLTDPALQKVITALCVADKAKLLVLDNLSCLFRGIKENDNDAWEAVLNWLLDLRRQKIAVLIVHHAGRSGVGMRGASRREDAAFWVVKIEKIEEGENGSKGARFRTIFEKQRNSQEREWDKDWNVVTEEDGKVNFTASEVELETRILELITDGVEYASEIAKALGCESYTVSRKVKRLIDQKLVKKSGKRYVQPEKPPIRGNTSTRWWSAITTPIC
jgi:AAA domain